MLVRCGPAAQRIVALDKEIEGLAAVRNVLVPVCQFVKTHWCDLVNAACRSRTDSAPLRTQCAARLHLPQQAVQIAGIHFEPFRQQLIDAAVKGQAMCRLLCTEEQREACQVSALAIGLSGSQDAFRKRCMRSATSR